MTSSDRAPDEREATTRELLCAECYEMVRVPHAQMVAEIRCSQGHVLLEALAPPAPVETGTREESPSDAEVVQAIGDICSRLAAGWDEAHASATLDRDEGEGVRCTATAGCAFDAGHTGKCMGRFFKGEGARTTTRTAARVAYLEAALRQIVKHEGLFIPYPLNPAETAILDMAGIASAALAGTWRDEA